VSLRKICGAQRPTLVLQFLGESLLYALVATVLAVALTEWSLPYANAFLDAGATFDYWREPGLLGALALATVGFGVLAGIYPAFVLTAYRPVGVLNGWTQHSRNAGTVRQVLVTLQFAILITLMICTGVVYLQRHYATQDALRADTDQMLAIWPCRETLVEELRGLQGVRGVACSGLQILGPQGFRSMSASAHRSMRAVDGSSVTVNMAPIDFGLFDLFGVPPIAGRLSTAGAGTTSASNAAYVINETAARQLGFASPQAAVGQHVRPPPPGPDLATSAEEHEVIAVIPDFTLASIEQRIEPTVYFALPEQFGLTMVKLSGREIPATLVAIDKLWTKVGGTGPINRFFLEEHIQLLYLAMLRQAQAFSLFSGIAVVLALVGLLGLAASAAERRTKEIGIRKSMGAQTGNIVRLLLWQFTKPVVWACLIAWPVAGYLMQRWLRGFAYHVDLPLWLFPAAGCAALLIAVFTVGGHSFLVARAKPIAALRYE
jgi:putative ABC transport system permease protein